MFNSPPLSLQVNENARQDLKEGLVLYNTDNNVGLRDAWNSIQREVNSRQPLEKTDPAVRF